MAERYIIGETEVTNLTPLKAREVIVKCFFHAQKEAFDRSHFQLGMTIDDAGLMNSISGSVRMAFREVNGDFDNPSKDELEKVVQVLTRKASVWGIPPEIVDHHKNQVHRLLLKLH